MPSLCRNWLFVWFWSLDRIGFQKCWILQFNTMQLISACFCSHMPGKHPCLSHSLVSVWNAGFGRSCCGHIGRKPEGAAGCPPFIHSQEWLLCVHFSLAAHWICLNSQTSTFTSTVKVYVQHYSSTLCENTNTAFHATDILPDCCQYLLFSRGKLITVIKMFWWSSLISVYFITAW